MAMKAVVELDLVGYSDISRTLEDNLGAEVVARFNEHIQGFVDAGLAAAQAAREEVVKATTGDGAILAFAEPADAHRFAVAVHEAARRHNAKRALEAANRWFRIGIATGHLHECDGKMAGMVIVRAVRMEAAGQPGQVLIDAATFDGLPADYQTLYGPEETVAGKRAESFVVHRLSVVPYKAPDAATPSVMDVLQLFEQLQPRHQMHRLMLLLEIPEQFQPSRDLELHHRQDKILQWATSGGKLPKLAAALKELIGKQSPRS